MAYDRQTTPLGPGPRRNGGRKGRRLVDSDQKAVHTHFIAKARKQRSAERLTFEDGIISEARKAFADKKPGAKSRHPTPASRTGESHGSQRNGRRTGSPVAYTSSGGIHLAVSGEPELADEHSY